MNRDGFLRVVVLGFVTLLSGLGVTVLPGGGIAAPALPKKPAVSSRPEVLSAYAQLPLQFEANQGQTDPQVKFLARGLGYTVFLTPGEAVLGLHSHKPSDQTSALGRVLGRLTRAAYKTGNLARSRQTMVRVKFAGANPEPDVAGLEPLPGRVNYFIGNHAEKWRTDIPTYSKVRYRDVYPGVDVVYYGAQRRLEYDVVVAPGADPKRIILAVTGADNLDVDAAGDLVLHIPGGSLRLHKPLIYQEVDGVRREIAGGYVLLGTHQVGLRFAAYDASRPLVIDPVLSYSTFLGGSGSDEGAGIAVDGAGNAYVTGSSPSVDFPTANALQPALGGFFVNAFVAKVNASGSALVYSTFLGGSGIDKGFGIAVDGVGNAYVTGFTNSANFPTMNALQPALRGSFDAFVAKVNASGSALVYSTFLGGSGSDEGAGIAVDSAGDAYVAGVTGSSDFPTVNALQPALGGVFNAFVAKVNASGSALVYSTFLGGSGIDEGFGIAVDGVGNAYVAGVTGSSDFPTMNALQPVFGGESDAFVVKVNASGSALVYSTFLGGSGIDEGRGIAVGGAGDAYVTGFTDSANFPAGNALQPTLGFEDAFVLKIGGPLPFAAFSAKAEINVADGEFEIEGTFTLGAGSNGIKPSTEDVELQVGTFSITIAAGSFHQTEKGRFKFEGIIHGVSLEVVIAPRRGRTFAFTAEARGAKLAGTAKPVPVQLTIGNDTGRTAVRAKLEADRD